MEMSNTQEKISKSFEGKISDKHKILSSTRSSRGRGLPNLIEGIKKVEQNGKLVRGKKLSSVDVGSIYEEFFETQVGLRMRKKIYLKKKI